MKWYKVPDFALPDGPFLKKVRVGGKSVCLVGYEGEIFAISDTCPHAGGLLSGGWCWEGKIVCPIHRYSYDLHTGKGSPGQNDFIEVYEVDKRDDGLYLGMTGFWKRVVKGFK